MTKDEAQWPDLAAQSKNEKTFAMANELQSQKRNNGGGVL